MKQKLLKYPKLMLIGLLLVFASCDKDPVLEEEVHGHGHGKNPNEVSMDFFKEMTQIEDVGLFLKEQMMATSALSRMSSYRFTDFTIDKDVIYQLELRNGERAFSFKLYPNDGIAERDEMFNLVITRAEGKWQSSIFLLLKNPDTASEDFFSEIEEVYQSAGLPENFTFRSSVRHRGNKIWHCPYPKGHCAGRGGACDLCSECLTIIIEKVTLPPLQEYDTPTLIDPAFVYNGGGGGASTHQTQEKEPCEILKQQSRDNLSFGKKLDSIKQRVLATNPNRDATETMISVRRSGEQYIYTATNTTAAVDGYMVVEGEITTSDVAVMHNHPVGTIPIFSPPDIVDFFISYNYVSESRKNEFTSYLVSFNNTTYALRMENTEALATLFAGLDLDSAEEKKKADNLILNFFNDYGMNKNQTYTQSMAENLFLNVLNDPKIGGGNGINLYRKDNDGWGKLTKTGNTIQKTPCN